MWFVAILAAIVGYEVYKHVGASAAATSVASYRVPVYQLTARTSKFALWHSTDAQSKTFGPQYPAGYLITNDLGNAFFVFPKKSAPAIASLQPGQISTYYYLYQPDWKVQLI
jgi:hypothetical protein